VEAETTKADEHATIVTALAVDRSLADAVAAIAARDPNAPAIAGTVWTATYAELVAAAGGIAARVLAREPAPGDRVALLMDHDAPAIAALLATAMTSLIRVPLNPLDPFARTAAIAAAVDPALVVTDAANHADAEQLAAATGASIVIVDDRPPPGDPPDVAVAGGDACSLMFTSGSAGHPKGVLTTHAFALRTAGAHVEGYGLGPGDRVALVSSLAGAYGIGAVWSALATGAALCPFPAMTRGLASLPAWLDAHGINVYASSVSIFRQFVRTLPPAGGPRGLRVVRLGSEPIERRDIEAFLEHFPEPTRLVSSLGMTETGNATNWELDRGAPLPDGRAPAGRATPGIAVEIHGDQGQPLPAGEVGEIVMRGPYLALEYWRDPELTAARFSGDGANRRFRTMDVGWRDADGTVRVIGRADAMVKIRGTFVEPGEVELALAAQPGVDAAAVGVRPGPWGDARLTAYVVPAVGASVAPADLRSALSRLLPAAAVPSAFALTEALPMAPNGKVDRQALLDLKLVDEERGGGLLTETEALIAEIWRESLELVEVGRDDDFLALGGDSLSAAVVAAGIADALGVELELRAFTDLPTLAAMAAEVDRLRATGRAPAREPIVRVPRTGALPTSFSQERVWRGAQTLEGARGYRIANFLTLRGPLDRDRLREALQSVVDSHESLRTTFGAIEPVQIVHPRWDVALPFRDVSEADDPGAAAMQLLDELAAEPLDLTRLPLARYCLVRLGAREHRLLRCQHHIITDGWSRRVFARDLARTYEALGDGRRPVADSTAPQVADAAAVERRRFAPGSPARRHHYGWWRARLAAPATPPRLPFERAAPVSDVVPSDGVIRFGIDARVASALGTLGRVARVTPFMTMLALLTAQLGAETGADEVVLGTHVSTRRNATVNRLIGFFSNLTTLRAKLPPPDVSFRAWLAHVRGLVVELGEHADLPHEELCADLRRDGIEPPVLRAIVGVTRPVFAFRGGELEIRNGIWLVRHYPWGFSLNYSPDPPHTANLAAFDPRQHDPDGVRAFIERFCAWGAVAAAEPDATLPCLARAAGAHRGRIVSWLPSTGSSD
jgi:non-ribosomal peptide synthetase component F